MSTTHQTKLINEFTHNFRRLAGCQVSRENTEVYQDPYEKKFLGLDGEEWRMIIQFSLSTTLALFLAFWAISSYAAEIPEETAVHCIMGEARLDYVRGDKEAFITHAEALRNRGHIGGVHGCKERWGRTPAKYAEDVNYCKIKGLFEIARKAWRDSKYTNIVKGADHWGSLSIDGDWIATMERKGFILTKKTKTTAFYLARSK